MGGGGGLAGLRLLRVVQEVSAEACDSNGQPLPTHPLDGARWMESDWWFTNWVMADLQFPNVN